MRTSKKYQNGTFNWKMLFNPDITKQAREVIFSRKNAMVNHSTIFFNETPVVHTSCQKHLGMHLDEKLNFNTHIKDKIAKANEGIGIIHKLAVYCPENHWLYYLNHL